MAPRLRACAAAAAVLVISVALSGCLTVYPAKALFSGEGSAGQTPTQLVVAYERRYTPADSSIDSGSETRTVYVAPGSVQVTIALYAKLTSVPEWVGQIDTRHFDFTVTDGAGTAWVDVHLRNNSTQRTVVVEGPRPGGWTVTLNYQVQALGLPGIPADEFDVKVLVAQPVV